MKAWKKSERKASSDYIVIMKRVVASNFVESYVRIYGETSQFQVIFEISYRISWGLLVYL